MQRSRFLKSLWLSACGLQLDPGLPFVTSFKNHSNNPLQLFGKVVSNGTGIGGVQVTDGFTITETNKDGQYNLPANEAAEFIYITIPAGYAFTNEKSVSKFYKKIIRVEKEFRADFELQKLNRDDAEHYFIVWADPQIESAKDAALLHSQSVPDTYDLIKGYGKDALFHGIGCGDLIWDRPGLFNDYIEAIRKIGIPFFHVKGNHDIDTTCSPHDYSGESFKKHFGPLYYSFNRGLVHYVVLDDVFFLGQSGKYVGYVPGPQIDWLKQDLAFVKPGSTIVISLHIPLNTGMKRRNNLTDEVMKDVVANREELLDILGPFNVHIISGHLHANEKVFHRRNITQHVHGALCGAWWSGPVCNDGCPNGYGVYEVNGEVIQWYHKAVGYSKQYQMQVYPVGSIQEKPDFFAVNVWNWDPEWKIEWFENGIYQGELKREVDLDPFSVLLYSGNEKPKQRKWIEPAITDHLFIAKPSSADNKVTVQVTDRFKNVYKNDMSTVKLLHTG